MIELKYRWNSDKILSTSQSASTIREAVIEAVSNDANLRGADLGGADLGGADLGGADLRGADLRDTDLRGADLRGANLRGANLRGANLGDADLGGADLGGADLRGADLQDTRASELTLARLSIVPESGPFQGWKKCRDGLLVRLEIPEDARRSNSTGRKCRAEFARVVEIVRPQEMIIFDPPTWATSLYDSNFTYRPGEIVRCNEWNEDRWVECGGGIHFYLTRIEAENHS